MSRSPAATKKLNSLMEKLNALTNEMHEIQSAVQKMAIQGRRKEKTDCLALYGIPEGRRTEGVVQEILSHAELSKEDYRILYRMGKKRTDGSCRPIRVRLNDGVPMPSLRDLAAKLLVTPHLASYNIRMYQTKEEQYKSWVIREEKRRREERESLSSSPESSGSSQGNDLGASTEELRQLLEKSMLFKTYDQHFATNLIELYNFIPDTDLS